MSYEVSYRLTADLTATGLIKRIGYQYNNGIDGSVAASIYPLLRLEEWLYGQVHNLLTPFGAPLYDTDRLVMDRFRDTGYSESIAGCFHPDHVPRLIRTIMDRVDQQAHVKDFLQNLSGPHHQRKYQALDIACGRAGPMIEVANAWGINIVGVDFLDCQLNAATDNLRKFELEKRCHVGRGDAQDLCFPGESFPLVYSVEAATHFPDKSKFIQEATRVLQRDGILFFTDLTWEGIRPDHIGYQFGIPVDKRTGEALTDKQIQQLNIYRDFCQAWDVPDIFSKEEYRRALDENGLKSLYEEEMKAHNLQHLSIIGKIMNRIANVPGILPLLNKLLKPYGINSDNIYQLNEISARATDSGLLGYSFFVAKKASR